MTPTKPPPWSHPAALDDDALLAQCEFARGRSTGPGGQHRNKVETLVDLTHRSTGISAHAGERRSVRENKPVALRRLRLKLATQIRCAVPLGEIGSELWKSRLRPSKRGPGSQPSAGGRIECNPRHRDYPALLAEAMDVIADAGWDARRAALRLEVSATQLIKLIKEHPPALEVLNEHRQQRGAHSLK